MNERVSMSYNSATNISPSLGVSSRLFLPLTLTRWLLFRRESICNARFVARKSSDYIFTVFIEHGNKRNKLSVCFMSFKQWRLDSLPAWQPLAWEWRRINWMSKKIQFLKSSCEGHFLAPFRLIFDVSRESWEIVNQKMDFFRNHFIVPILKYWFSEPLRSKLWIKSNERKKFFLLPAPSRQKVNRIFGINAARIQTTRHNIIMFNSVFKTERVPGVFIFSAYGFAGFSSEENKITCSPSAYVHIAIKAFRDATDCSDMAYVLTMLKKEILFTLRNEFMMIIIKLQNHLFLERFSLC